MKQDPVCLMEVKETEAVTAECDGVLYYFCSEGCRDKFLKERTCARTAYDLVIIGGGPAGLTAAVYAATLKMEALLVAADCILTQFMTFPSWTAGRAWPLAPRCFSNQNKAWHKNVIF